MLVNREEECSQLAERERQHLFDRCCCNRDADTSSQDKVAPTLGNNSAGELNISEKSLKAKYSKSQIWYVERISSQILVQF